MNIQNIQDMINSSLIELINHDEDLIRRNVKEECINHKFALYLERFLEQLVEYHDLYHVDIEYNKNYIDPEKCIIDEYNNRISIRPDIIIHNRFSNQNNLIAFEIKKSYTSRRDYLKIRGLMRNPYNYSYGCLLSYLPEREYFLIKILIPNHEGMLIYRLRKRN